MRAARYSGKYSPGSSAFSSKSQNALSVTDAPARYKTFWDVRVLPPGELPGSARPAGKCSSLLRGPGWGWEGT